MDDRILQALKREHPPPILDSAGRLAAVKLTVGFKGDPSLQFNKKITHAIRNASNSRGVESRPEAKLRVQPTQRKAAGTRPAARETRSTSRRVKYLPKIQCHHCLTFLTKGIVYCTCGIWFRPSDKTRKLNKDLVYALSIANYVINKGPSHGARLGNTE